MTVWKTPALFITATLSLSLPLLLAQAPAAVSAEVVKVVSKKLEKAIPLPGDLYAYESVAIYPKVTGFVESIPVDRGTWLKKDQLIAKLTAPEVLAQRAQAEANVQRVESQRAEAEAKLASLEATVASAQTTFDRLKAASQTPGVVAGNDLDVALKSIEAQRSGVDAQRSSIAALRNEKTAAEAALRAIKELEGYLQISAPFDGVIIERNAHPGSLAGPSAGPSNPPLVRIEQVSRLRLVVPVPEAYVGSIPSGSKVSFTVPAYPAETFSGVVQRLAHSLDFKTRTMLVEMDVTNPQNRLAPGMFANVNWPISRGRASVFVPPSAIVSTTEKTFVIRVKNNTAEWVDVRRGVADGNLIEVLGNLSPDDFVVRRGTDEIRNGAKINPQTPAPPKT